MCCDGARPGEAADEGETGQGKASSREGGQASSGQCGRRPWHLHEPAREASKPRLLLTEGWCVADKAARLVKIGCEAETRLQQRVKVVKVVAVVAVALLHAQGAQRLKARMHEACRVADRACWRSRVRSGTQEGSSGLVDGPVP